MRGVGLRWAGSIAPERVASAVGRGAGAFRRSRLLRVAPGRHVWLVRGSARRDGCRAYARRAAVAGASMRRVSGLAGSFRRSRLLRVAPFSDRAQPWGSYRSHWLRAGRLAGAKGFRRSRPAVGAPRRASPRAGSVSSLTGQRWPRRRFGGFRAWRGRRRARCHFADRAFCGSRPTVTSAWGLLQRAGPLSSHGGWRSQRRRSGGFRVWRSRRRGRRRRSDGRGWR